VEFGSIDTTGIKVKISPSGFSSTAAYNFTGWSDFSGVPTWAALFATEWGGGPEQTLALGLGTSGTTTPTRMILNLGTNSGPSYAANIIMTAMHGSTADIQFNADTSSFFIDGSTVMSLVGSGVAIGTTSPTSGYALDVNGALLSRSFLRVGVGAIGYTQIQQGTASQTGYFEVKKADSTRLGYIGWDNTNFGFTADNGANFEFSGGYVRINNSGGLYLTGNGGTDRIYNLSSSGLAIDATNNGGNPSFLTYDAATFINETLVLGYTNGGTSTITTYNANQNLEIVPTGTLTINPGGTNRVYFTDTDIEVQGIMLRNWVDGAGQGYACANVDGNGDGFITYKTTSACGTSSLRFKENVRPLDMAGAEAILHLTPVTYTLKANPDAGFQFGAIAEQAAGLGLEWLVEREPDGQVRNLLYDRIPLYLIPIVKQQQERITELERRLAALENKKH
jgi:hypothetical protein